MSIVTVLGGGSFGTALATLFAQVGHDEVRLWSHDPEQVKTINATRHNPKYLSEYELHSAIVAHADIREALNGTGKVVVAIPSQVLRGVLVEVADGFPEVPVILGSKGIENDTLMTLDEVVQDVLGEGWEQRTLALSGPSFAKEIMKGDPTAVVLASQNIELADELSAAICVGQFRAYSSSDIVGVELGGALKNVMAIACGMTMGAGLGESARAALITRGFTE
ncbi:MAG: NAD(P)H-dependent glycerol-3-phosphate dehydrogenase, partial [Myxococcota bacterium]